MWLEEEWNMQDAFKSQHDLFEKDREKKSLLKNPSYLNMEFFQAETEKTLAN